MEPLRLRIASKHRRREARVQKNRCFFIDWSPEKDRKKNKRTLGSVCAEQKTGTLVQINLMPNLLHLNAGPLGRAAKAISQPVRRLAPDALYSVPEYRPTKKIERAQFEREVWYSGRCSGRYSILWSVWRKASIGFREESSHIAEFFAYSSKNSGDVFDWKSLNDSPKQPSLLSWVGNAERMGRYWKEHRRFEK